MSSFILKIIALTTMIIDHYGAIFQGDMTILRIIGRLAFPIYCFLLVEGYYHTRNVKKYALRLLLFAFISEIPFDLAFFGRLYFSYQNIFFTLFIGLTAIYFLDNKDGRYNFNSAAVIIAACVLASLLSTDYQAIGIIYIIAFYYGRKYDKLNRFLTIGIIMFIVNFGVGMLQQFSLLALPLIYLYNGESGSRNKFLQIMFYAAYPLHLILFYFFKIV